MVREIGVGVGGYVEGCTVLDIDGTSLGDSEERPEGTAAEYTVGNLVVDPTDVIRDEPSLGNVEGINDDEINGVSLGDGDGYSEGILDGYSDGTIVGMKDRPSLGNSEGFSAG